MADLLSSNIALAPTTKTTETVLPDWYTNYAMNILSGQQAVAATPYTTYQGPRVAEFTPAQQQAFGMTQQAATAYQPGLQQAEIAAQQAGPLTGIALAAPYLGQAGQTAPSQVQQYMDPYQQAVISRIGDIGARTLREQLLPQIRDRFIAAGQYGGSRQAEMMGRGLRDIYESTLAKQAELLSQSYGGALTAAQEDLRRQAALAGTAGQLGTAASQAGVQQAGALADIAKQQQALGLTGAGAVGQVGALQQQQAQQNLDLAYKDFLAQQGYNQQQINAMMQTLGGVYKAVPTATLESQVGPIPTTQQTGTSTGQTIASGLATLKALIS